MRMFGRALLCALLVMSGPSLGDDISNGSYSTTDGGNNAAPPNGWPAGMFPNQVEPSARSNMGATARWWERANAKLSTTGAAGAYVLTPSNTSYPTAYTQGEVYCAKANFTAVGNDTLNVNGLGAKPFYVMGISGLERIGPLDIFVGTQFCASYDAALNAGAGGFQIIAGFTPGKVVSGSAWGKLPGGLFIETIPYSVTASNTVNTPAGTVWTLATLVHPRALPHGIITAWGAPNATANGNFTTTSIIPIDNTQTQIVVTAWAGATQPLTGYLVVLGY